MEDDQSLNLITCVMGLGCLRVLLRQHPGCSVQLASAVVLGIRHRANCARVGQFPSRMDKSEFGNKKYKITTLNQSFVTLTQALFSAKWMI
jgi:hypothetical protein